MPPRKYTRPPSSSSESEEEIIRPPRRNTKDSSSGSEEEKKLNIKISNRPLSSSSESEEEIIRPPRRNTKDSSSDLEEKKLNIKISNRQLSSSSESEEEIIRPPTRNVENSSSDLEEKKLNIKISNRQLSSEDEDEDGLNAYPEITKAKTAQVQEYESKSKLEKIPTEILKKISSFLANPDKGAVTLTSPRLRKVVRATPLNLTDIAFNYKNLVRFLRNNPDLNVTGFIIDLTEENTPDNIDELRPFLTKATDLIIYCDDDTDLSALKVCTKLSSLIVTRGHALEYITQCTELKYLEIRMASYKRAVLNFPKLNGLYLSDCTFTNLDVSLCPKLSILSFDELLLDSINVAGNIKMVDFDNVTGLDMSFLSECKKLNYLNIKTHVFDVDLLKGLNHLTILKLSIRTLRGDLNKLTNLARLDIVLYDHTLNIKELPPNLIFLRLFLAKSQEPQFNIQGVSRCSQLRTLMLSTNGSINLKELSGCSLLTHLYIDCKYIYDDEYLERFPLLSTLQLICQNDSFETKFSKCSMLEYFYLWSKITNLNLLKDCRQLKYLVVIAPVKNLEPLVSCYNLVNLCIESMEKIDYRPLLQLRNLSTIYVGNDKTKMNELSRMGLKVTTKSLPGDISFDSRSEKNTIMDTPD